MKKILLACAILSSIGISNAIDMHTINCKGEHLNSATTLKNVEDKCQLTAKQYTSHDLFEVSFVNDFNKKTVDCYFARDEPDAKLNSCQD